ncbi:MAG TPA: hypothetical protein VN822_07170 [Candidatus Acidoferrales bacterium]|nr:hypothetical protein [Candidatus Acidoferrales bacterium]
MPKQPNHPSRQEIEHEEEARRRLEADAVSRQSNVLPMDAARNEGRFYGRLIRGDRPPNGVQRVGFFLVGSLFCLSAIFIFGVAFPRLFSFIGLPVALAGDKSVSVLYLPFAVLSLFLGLKVIGRAVAPRGRKR